MCESTSRSSVVEERRGRSFVARKSGTLIEQPVELLPRMKSNKSQLITWQRSCCCFGDGGRNVFSACWFRGSYFDVRDRMQRILVEFFTDARCAVTHGALVWIADDCCDSDWRRYARIECIQSQSRDRCCRLDGDVDEYRFDSAYVDLGRQRVELRNGRARTAVQFHVRLERHVSLPLRDSSGDGGDGDRPVKGCHRCRCYWKTLLSGAPKLVAFGAQVINRFQDDVGSVADDSATAEAAGRRFGVLASPSRSCRTCLGNGIHAARILLLPRRFDAAKTSNTVWRRYSSSLWVQRDPNGDSPLCGTNLSAVTSGRWASRCASSADALRDATELNLREQDLTRGRSRVASARRHVRQRG